MYRSAAMVCSDGVQRYRFRDSKSQEAALSRVAYCLQKRLEYSDGARETN